MADQSDLSPRNREILHSIVRSYIETGEPVASRTVSRHRRDHLSPASIRNVMGDLCEEGYLAQPHTSAGRVPTAKAFRSYIESLTCTRLAAEDLAHMKAELARATSLERQVERSSHLLTVLTRGFGIAVAFPDAGQVMEHVELVALADRRVLMVLATRDHVVRHRVLTLEEAITPEELASIRNYLNRDFQGWSLSEIRAELQRRLSQERAAYDAVLRKLTMLYARGLLDVELSPEVHTEGASNLVGADLHLTQEKMRALFRALEEKKRILELLERFLENPAGGVAVQVGLGEAHPSMDELSLIGVSVQMPGGLSAKIAVLGPMRMNYSKAMAAVLHMGEAIRNLPA